jgi:hypothetical protein
MRSLDKAAARIVQEAVATIEVPPQDFDSSGSYDMKRGLVSGAALASVGAFAGAGVGIAAFGTAISGAWVLAPVLGLVGLRAGRSGDKAS